MPADLAGLPDSEVFLADRLGEHLDSMRVDPMAPVAVVGGGQTGLEAVLRLLHSGFRSIRWLTRGQWFQTIDDSPVANEFYRPAHQRFLQTLTVPTRRRLVLEQETTGDACTPGALRTLYQANYDGMLAYGHFPVTLLPGRTATSVELRADGPAIRCRAEERDEIHQVAHVVVAVGRETMPIPFSPDLAARVGMSDGDLDVGPDYAVRWDGHAEHRIFAMNRCRFTHGVPDANLTLLPVRAATVLNSLFDRDLFVVRDDLCPISWN